MKTIYIFFGFFLFQIDSLHLYVCNAIKNHQHTNIDQRVYQFPDKDIIEQIYACSTDTDNADKKNIAKILINIGLRSTNTAIRQNVIEQLIGDCFDEEMNFITAKDILRERGFYKKDTTTNDMIGFVSQDFSDIAVKKIEQLLCKKFPDKNVILVAGISKSSNLHARLYEIIDEAKIFLNENTPQAGTYTHACHLALARNGHQESINYCFDIIKNEKDSLFLVTKRFEEAAYIRQPKSIEYLSNFLFNNNKKLHTAERALNQLSKFVKGFPIAYKNDVYTPTDIATARQWLRNQSRFEIIR